MQREREVEHAPARRADQAQKVTWREFKRIDFNGSILGPQTQEVHGQGWVELTSNLAVLHHR